MKKYLFAFLFAALAFSFIGCATVPPVAPPKPPVSGTPGTYHRVEKKETLWRISRMYNIDIDELAKVNHISDATSIEVGQLIFIPQAQKPAPVQTVCALPGEEFIWPLRGKVIGQFGQNYNDMLNKGLNIQPYRSLDVVASRSGKVAFYDDNFLTFGKTVIIDHGDGFFTVYSRNSEVFVKAGDLVQKGNIIAKAGQAGKDKNTYLHFEIRKGSSAQNPYFYLQR
ncbi:MAG: LysM peptidoglycan-binding domain-containing M23 family metallopeptidase [Candidatus Omnitrophica bacterium]|nr:LysM peptidoglycan-binding domain-containing M23 family metallopeptidase [Candidatus Omnitrophota bacterium]